MAYIAQKTRIASITIDGTDYTDEFISFEVSDESAWQNGLLVTSGQVILAQRPAKVGVTEISNYSRDQFKRNSVVILRIEDPTTGAVSVHPRGHLRVITTAYDIENEELIIEVGCRLAIALLTEDRRELANLLPIELEPARNTINNYSGAFWGAGKYVYQNNTGALVVGKFWENDGTNSFGSGRWVSVLGETVLVVSPLEASDPGPDQVNFSYDRVKDPEESAENDAGDIGTQPDFGFDGELTPDPGPGSGDGYEDPGDPEDPSPGSGDPVTELIPGEDNTGYIDRVSESSNYFIAFPATVARRTPPPGDGGITEILDLSTLSPFPSSASGIEVDIFGGGGTGAIGRVETDASGSVTAVQIASAGSNYNRGSVVTMREVDGTGVAQGRIAAMEEEVPEEVVQPPTELVPQSGCGNTPAAPSTPSNSTGGGDGEEDQGVNEEDPKPVVLCSDNWTTNRETVYLPATSLATTVTYYNGPAAQASMVKRNLLGAALEVNPQYFADKYAYCTLVWGTACNVNGNCPYYGLERIRQSYSYTQYYYSSVDNSLFMTVEDVYQNTLSAAVPADWRSGIVNGKPVAFRDLSYDEFYRARRTITSYKASSGLNIQTTITYNSITSRGVGIASGQSLDALDGIRTSSRRISTDNEVLDIAPDALNTPTFETESFDFEELLTEAEGLPAQARQDNAYGANAEEEESDDGNDDSTNPANDDDLITLEMRLPVPLKGTDQQVIETVEAFSKYTNFFVKGQKYGLRIAEPLRPEIASNWYPGVPFRYYDTQNDRLIAFRADAAVWAVTPEESAMVCDGMFQGFSSGTVSVGDNLSGNSRPDMGSGTTPPTTPSGPPSVENDLVGQSYAFRVKVDLYLNTSITTFFASGIGPTEADDTDVKVEQSLATYCTGFIVAPGGLLATEGNGSIPIDYKGSIVSSNATIINRDLFAPAA
jgi:hypothetical protein